MIFMIGIEEPTSQDEAYGIFAPAFDNIGYGCYSAADKEKDILSQAKLAILTMAAEAVKEGFDLKRLDQGYKDHGKAHPEYNTWIALDVPIEELKPKQKRINITLPEPLIHRVDAYVSSHKEFKDRSAFLAQAAAHFMHDKH